MAETKSTVCVAPDCDRPRRRNGPKSIHCSAHYQQVRAGNPLTKVKQKRKQGATLERDEYGRKQCGYCQEWHPESQYDSHKFSSDRLMSRCKRCRSRIQRAKFYSMTDKEVDQLIALQGGRCAVCNSTETGDHKGWRIDHDHSCCPGARSCGKCVRGALCSPCNLAIGLMRDSPDVLKSAAAYLMKHTAALQLRASEYSEQ